MKSISIFPETWTPTIFTSLLRPRYEIVMRRALRRVARTSSPAVLERIGISVDESFRHKTSAELWVLMVAAEVHLYDVETRLAAELSLALIALDNGDQAKSLRLQKQLYRQRHLFTVPRLAAA